MENCMEDELLTKLGKYFTAMNPKLHQGRKLCLTRSLTSNQGRDQGHYEEEEEEEEEEEG